MREQANLREHLKMIANSIDNARHGTRSQVVAQHAADLAMAPATLYRTLATEIGWASGRKIRADKGKTCVPIESLHFAAGLQRTSRRKNGKLTLHAPMTKMVTMSAGMEMGVTAQRMQVLLREHKLNADTLARPAPHVQMRSTPNQCHEVDPSLCLIYYSPNGEQRMVRDDENYKNKPDFWAKVKFKVWRYVLVDHASHWIFVRYFESMGETQDNLFRFLMQAWAKDGERTFHGVPQMLMMDPGSANTAKAIANLCDALEVKLLINLPGQPRGKGGVEVANNITETHLESLLRFQPVHSVAELNEAATAWCNAYNANLIPNLDSRLMRPGMTQAIARNDLWLKIKPDALRLCPPLNVCAALMQGATATRKVSGSLMVSYRHPAAARSLRYDLRGIREVGNGDEVTIRPLVYGDQAVMVTYKHRDGQEKHFRIEPVAEVDEFGFRVDAPSIGEGYHSLPAHDAEGVGEALDQAAYGIDADGVIRTPEEIAKLKASGKAQPFAHLNDGQGLKPLDALRGIQQPTYLPKKGVAITPKAPAVSATRSAENEVRGFDLNVPSTMHVGRGDLLPVTTIARRLKDELGEWSAERMAQLSGRWPDGAFEDEYTAILEWFQGRRRLQVVG